MEFCFSAMACRRRAKAPARQLSGIACAALMASRGSNLDEKWSGLVRFNRFHQMYGIWMDFQSISLARFQGVCQVSRREWWSSGSGFWISSKDFHVKSHSEFKLWSLQLEVPPRDSLDRWLLTSIYGGYLWYLGICSIFSYNYSYDESIESPLWMVR